MIRAHNVQPTANASEVIVVGGGPVGSYTALSLAKLGAKVTVFEEHPSIGFPSHCAGHISIRSLKAIGLYPLPGIVENTFDSANFYSPSGFKFSLHLSCPVTAALNRSLLDQYLAKQAQEAGANFCLNSRVQSLILEDNFVKGIELADNKKIYSKITVDAEGISSRLLKQAGLKPFNPKKLVYAVQADVSNVKNVESNAVEVYFGKSYAPGFYGWLIPRLDGSAKVGLATNKGNPRDFLKNLMFKHPVASKQLANAKITNISFHPITLGGLIPKAYSNGFLAVGDTASQVKPTTGGGVIFGLTSARIAAQVAVEALQKDDYSSDSLTAYQKRCNDALGFDLGVMLRLRHFLDSLSDQKIDEVLKFCKQFRVDNALRNVKEVDFQGQMILKQLGKPSMLVASVYFLMLYLSTNV